MPSQNDYDRVNKHMIAPLCIQFGLLKMDDILIDGFVDELSGFNEQTLKDAFKHLRRSHKRMPALAHVIEACEACKPRTSTHVSSQKNQIHCVGNAEITHPNSVREIFDTEAGQLALQLGVGRDLMVEYELTGQKVFTENFVRKCHQSAKNAAQSLSEIKPGDAMFKALNGLWEVMQEREKMLYNKYLSQLVASL